MKSTFWSIQEPLKENTWTSIRRIINNVSVQTIYFSKKKWDFRLFCKRKEREF